jgi:hypothetical protein
MLTGEWLTVYNQEILYEMLNDMTSDEYKTLEPLRNLVCEL